MKTSHQQTVPKDDQPIKIFVIYALDNNQNNVCRVTDNLPELPPQNITHIYKSPVQDWNRNFGSQNFLYVSTHRWHEKILRSMSLSTACSLILLFSPKKLRYDC